MALNELQLALLGAGAVAVLAVWGYNRWQLRRWRRQTETLLPATEEDALVATSSPSRSEPTLAESDASDESHAMAAEKNQPAAAEDDARKAFAPLPREWGDESIDCFARLRFDAPVSRAELLAARNECLARIAKPSQWFVWAAGQAQWEMLRADATGFAEALTVALQLADRRGALTEEEFSAFVAGLTEMARRFSGQALLPDVATTLARAHRLDAFCGEVDLQFGLRLVPLAEGGSFSAAEVQRWLAETNLVAEGDRHLALVDDGSERFSLVGLDAQGQSVALAHAPRLAALVFALDVPRVADGPAAFDALLACARQAAQRLAGRIADVHGRPLPETSAAAIRARIAELQAKMAKQGIPAGSPRALRLFA